MSVKSSRPLRSDSQGFLASPTRAPSGLDFGNSAAHPRGWDVVELAPGERMSRVARLAEMRSRHKAM